MEKIAYYNAFNMISFLGYRRVKALLRHIPDIEKAWYADIAELKQAEGWSGIAEKFTAERKAINVDKEWEKLKGSGVWAITVDDPSYPEMLEEIYSPPLVLYGEGEFPGQEKALAMVGSRKATVYGKEVATRLARELAAQGVTIVSGMALGIDTYAHWGALESNGFTVAVLGCGLDFCYPSRNYALKQEIVKNGAVISEFPLGSKPVPHNFPRRNRIISGLTQGTLVVEAMERSGALITADFALEQGREVYAVPGNINSPYSRGCNKLIKQGAKLIDSSEDIWEDWEGSVAFYGNNTFNTSGDIEAKNTQMCLLDEEEEKLLEALPFQPMHIDELVHVSGMSVNELSGVLLSLELKKMISQLPGKYFTRI